MQVIHSFEPQQVALIGRGIQVALVAPEWPENGLRSRLSSLGSKVEQKVELYEALEAMIDDPFGYGLCVIDCDLVGGLAVGRRAVHLLSVASRRIPVILVSRECTVQEFPADHYAPVVLRAPASAVSLRVGFEHALRDRLAARTV